ncbi:MAG: bifunctional (p)ppGpp synthetase/guanosine-3',5'-bis(diphosphate) 3'-pyrophosphohydrolase [Candidatus Aminicenantaceae bacterium]
MIRFDDILEKVSSSFSEKDITLLKKAYVFAAKAHKGQTRRSGEPYLGHPLEVTYMLADMKLDQTTLAVGLLHDVLEDSDVTAIELKEVFGKEIADLVDGVTKISRVQESSPEARQAENIRKIILAMVDDLRIIFIKLADRIHNLKTLKFLPENKQKQIARETLDIYAPIASRLGMGRIKAELEDLSFRYVSPEDYFKVVSLIEPQRQKAEKELKRFRRKLLNLMKDNSIPAEVYYRIKRPYSIHDKTKRRKVDFSQVYDFKALRLITDSIKNCYATLGIIHQNWSHLPHRVRDFIAMPKPNLYQSLHTTIITEEKQTFEIQIRTHGMHDIADNGIAAHWKYKESIPQHVIKEDARLKWLREMVELYKEQKNPREFLKMLKKDLVPEEVYVFTPQGKVLSLPLGASALDFAFKIHSEIGYHSTKAKINSRIVPLKAILKTGDVVEIITSPEARPKRAWLNMVFTSSARQHIKRLLNIQNRKTHTAFGKKLFEREIGKYGQIPPEFFEENNFVQNISKATNLRIKKIEDFYALIGFGKIILNKKFIEQLLSPEEIEKKKETIVKKVVTKVVRKTKSRLPIKENEVLLVNLAKCCSPIRGESIIGYITSGKGISVHSLRCPLVVKEILDSQRMIEVSWSSFPEGIYVGGLLIKSEDSPGVLAKVASAIAQLKGNITKADVVTFADQKAQLKLRIVIRDINHLEAIIKKMSGIKEIFSVERI